MAGYLNKVQLIGRLGRDPEIRSFPNGGKVASLRLATTESWRDKQTGERKERTEWHSVSITNEGLVRLAEQHLRKGAYIYIEGVLATRKWQDQSGQDRYSTEIALRPYSGELLFLESRRDSDQSNGGHDGGSYDDRGQGGGYGGGYGDPARQAPDGYSGGGHGSYRDSAGRPVNNRPNDIDDEIPF